jgi:hypothetical protein
MPGQKRVFALGVPGIHVFDHLQRKTQMAGTSPAMTIGVSLRGKVKPI